MIAPHRVSAVLSLGVFFILTGTTSHYVDEGNPYKTGPLPVENFNLSESEDDAPRHAIVYYPARPGVYAVLLFVGGFDGAIRVEMGYTDLLSRVSAHGFVVMGVDMRSAHGTGGLTRVRAASHRGNLPASPAQTFLQQLDWARKHLNAYLSNQTAGVSVDWEKTGIFCHSAGCAITLDMILLNHTGVKSTAFLEPFSFALSRGSSVDFRLPALMYGTQFCEDFPFCCVKGMDWNQIYDHWSCPKTLLATKNQGHCDILDHTMWEICHTTHFCKTGDVDNWAEYHTFMQGFVSAFFISTLQGVDDWRYLSNVTDIPIGVMNAKNDTNC
ncbi:chlorophyllase-1-like [Branchiostoma floridae]|uniref:Chlorophyllase-1-like n=1 Tax=Branchiostoma floridae TaxID=7739 RepID=A0A9J7NBI9_BRAFL|nr:chlorophyllase-1-like [Branchiostoma floridae]